MGINNPAIFCFRVICFFFLQGNDTELWATNVLGEGHRLDFQMDGHVVVYGLNNTVVWESDNGKSGEPNRLQMQNDGNLVVYDVNREPLWSYRQEL